MLTLGEKLNCSKKCLKRLSFHFKVFFYAKNGSKRQLILKNLDHFEIWQKLLSAKAIAFMERFVGCDRKGGVVTVTVDLSDLFLTFQVRDHQNSF